MQKWRYGYGAMSVQLAPSRRERKKQATRQALHEAAFTLAEERGLTGTTVEAIAERADVAPRTFFNYFTCKEDAVLDRDRSGWSASSRSCWPGRRTRTPSPPCAPWSNRSSPAGWTIPIATCGACG